MADELTRTMHMPAIYFRSALTTDRCTFVHGWAPV